MDDDCGNNVILKNERGDWANGVTFSLTFAIIFDNYFK